MPSYSSETPVRYKSLRSLGYPAYRVGTDGSVWSRKSGQWKRLKTWPWGSLGYPTVRVFEGDKSLGAGVHRIVLGAFVGPCPPGLQCCHEDGDPTNCHLSNLRWDTPKSNQADRKRHGTGHDKTQPRGERRHNARLTDVQVVEMRRLFDGGGWRQVDLCRKYGLDSERVHCIVRRKEWKHLS